MNKKLIKNGWNTYLDGVWIKDEHMNDIGKTIPTFIYNSNDNKVLYQCGYNIPRVIEKDVTTMRDLNLFYNVLKTCNYKSIVSGRSGT